MIVRGESTIIDYHASFDQGFSFPDSLFTHRSRSNSLLVTLIFPRFVLGRVKRIVRFLHVCRLRGNLGELNLPYSRPVTQPLFLTSDFSCSSMAIRHP